MHEYSTKLRLRGRSTSSGIGRWRKTAVLPSNVSRGGSKKGRKKGQMEEEPGGCHEEDPGSIPCRRLRLSIDGKRKPFDDPPTALWFERAPPSLFANPRLAWESTLDRSCGVQKQKILMLPSCSRDVLARKLSCAHPGCHRSILVRIDMSTPLPCRSSRSWPEREVCGMPK